MIRALLLDAGNTVVFLDMDAVAAVVREQGRAIDPELLQKAEGSAKRRYEAAMQSGERHEDGWGLYLTTLLEEGGLDHEVARSMIPPLRQAHDAFNLWRRVPDGLTEALQRVRDAGIRVAIVSNSEGKLAELFSRVGLVEHFEMVVDSHHEGVRKPDPEIFRRALNRMNVAPADAVYLGDIPGVDVLGAQAASIRAVLIDPFDFYADFDGERAPSVGDWIDRYLADQ